MLQKKTRKTWISVGGHPKVMSLMISFYVLDKFKYTNGNFPPKKKLWMRISWASQASFGSMWGCDDFVKFSYMKTLMCTPMSMKIGLG